MQSLRRAAESSILDGGAQMQILGHKVPMGCQQMKWWLVCRCPTTFVHVTQLTNSVTRVGFRLPLNLAGTWFSPEGGRIHPSIVFFDLRARMSSVRRLQRSGTTLQRSRR